MYLRLVDYETFTPSEHNVGSSVTETDVDFSGFVKVIYHVECLAISSCGPKHGSLLCPLSPCRPPSQHSTAFGISPCVRRSFQLTIYSDSENSTENVTVLGSLQSFPSLVVRQWCRFFYLSLTCTPLLQPTVV